jgi:uncharacterized protein Veg
MPYDWRGLGHRLEEGEISHWVLRDLSGILTGRPWSETERSIGPYQFEGKRLWNTYPTHFIIDVFQAMAGPDRDKVKREKETELVNTVELVANEYLEGGGTSIPADEFLNAINGRLSKPTTNIALGKVIGSMGIKKQKRGGHNQFVYDFSDILEATTEKT